MNIPTAEEFLRQEYERLNIKWSDGDLKSWRNEDIEILKGFAKLHVQEATKAAVRLSKTKWICGESGHLKSEDIELIYPLTNIK